MAVKPKPDGYNTINPYFFADDVNGLIAFMEKVFAGEVKECIKGPNDQVMHAEVRIGDSVVMMSPARGEWKSIPQSLYIYVDDVDAAYKRALEAGAASLSEPADQFYGDRSSGVKDPQGNFWWISTHIEDVTPEEMAKRMQPK